MELVIVISVVYNIKKIRDMALQSVQGVSMPMGILFTITVITLTDDSYIGKPVWEKMFPKTIFLPLTAIATQIIIKYFTPVIYSLWFKIVDIICLGVVLGDDFLIGIYSFAILFVEGFYQLYVTVRRSINPKITDYIEIIIFGKTFIFISPLYNNI